MTSPIEIYQEKYLTAYTRGLTELLPNNCADGDVSAAEERLISEFAGTLSGQIESGKIVGIRSADIVFSRDLGGQMSIGLKVSFAVG